MRECAAATSRGFAATAEKLLNTLGYSSTRKVALSGDVADFMDKFPVPNAAADTKSAKQFRTAVANVNIVFQFAESEIQDSIERGLLPPSTQFKKGDKNSFLFVAADLRKRKKGYSRSEYAEFVREINKRFNAPTVVLFRRSASDDAQPAFTLAFADRRKSKTRRNYDVLKKVSLLHEVRCDKPHHGHLDILTKLSLTERFNWMEHQKKPLNFDGLLAAWLDELDAEALNRRFYKALYRWFEWARDKAVFPCPPSKSRDKAERAKAAADSVIRLITRMMFIWFIKEKKLVAEDLFYEEDVAPLLANYDAAKGDTYYRAILQNLFFATLNTKIEKRGFNLKGQSGHRGGHGYRYKTLMADSDKILDLMNQTPFINGGLFDCLDKLKAGSFRADMFSDPDPKKWAAKRKEAFAALSVPNFLFFQDKKDKKEQRGLLTIFKKYKFTVEENTPVEQEVALDPELLGKVFENLLAEVNPETRESARNQTGSFYTPRAVVDYMTDESLVAYLAAKVPGDPGDRQWRKKLRDLLDYAKNECAPSVKAKRASLVGAIADVKVLDSACGSGAFPMGILNKLAFALSKLDPKNKEWKKLQTKRAAAAAHDAFYSVHDQDARAFRLKEVNRTFAHYSKPFGRKLFLIQNSIFGADIQPIACQIAKLRFFISLAIEQKKDEFADNFGIHQLPNLETRFVAADTLIRIGGVNLQDKLGRSGNMIKKLQKLLAENRERYFNAGVRNDKIECQDEDERLRDLLAEELASIPGLEPAAKGVAAWNPYDQNAVADWFDPEWMFGVSGFDVVIGNPPYIQLEANRGRLAKLYRPENYDAFTGNGDIYCLFYERGLGLLSPGGHLAYISSNKFMRTNYGKKLRGLLMNQTTLRTVIDFGENPVFEAGVDPAIALMQNALPPKGSKFTAAVIKKAEDIFQLDSAIANLGFEMLQSDLSESEWTLTSPDVLEVIKKMRRIGTPMKMYVRGCMHYGVKTGLDEAFIIDAETRRQLIDEAPNSAELIKLYLLGGEIKQWRIEKPKQYVIFTLQDTDINSYPAVKKHLAQYKDSLVRRAAPSAEYWYALQAPGTFYGRFGDPKIVYNETSKEIHSFIDHSGLYVNKTAFIVFAEDNEYLLGVLNSEMMDFYYRHTFPCWGDPWNRGRIQFQGIRMAAVPIFPANKLQRQKIARRVLAILESPQSASVRQLESEIDALVYQLYGLTKPEIALIKEWQAIRREAEQKKQSRRKGAAGAFLTP